MRWFRRRTPEPTPPDYAAAAQEFWRRWFDLLPETSAALGDDALQRVEEPLADAVAALHPDLQYSLDRGQRATYALVITGQENPALRPYTDAWKAAAPPDDAMWEYHDSVPPVPDPDGVTVNLGEQRIALADVRVVAQVDDLVDVAVYHPQMSELEGASRDAITFLPLDATLGERLAARWLGRVEAADHEPENTITLGELRDLVVDLDEGGHAVGQSR